MNAEKQEEQYRIEGLLYLARKKAERQWKLLNETFVAEYAALQLNHVGPSFSDTKGAVEGEDLISKKHDHQLREVDINVPLLGKEENPGPEQSPTNEDVVVEQSEELPLNDSDGETQPLNEQTCPIISEGCNGVLEPFNNVIHDSIVYANGLYEEQQNFEYYKGVVPLAQSEAELLNAPFTAVIGGQIVYLNENLSVSYEKSELSWHIVDDCIVYPRTGEQECYERLNDLLFNCEIGDSIVYEGKYYGMEYERAYYPFTWAVEETIIYNTGLLFWTSSYVEQCKLAEYNNNEQEQQAILFETVVEDEIIYSNDNPVGEYETIRLFEHSIDDTIMYSNCCNNQAYEHLDYEILNIEISDDIIYLAIFRKCEYERLYYPFTYTVDELTTFACDSEDGAADKSHLQVKEATDEEAAPHKERVQEEQRAVGVIASGPQKKQTKIDIQEKEHNSNQSNILPQLLSNCSTEHMKYNEKSRISEVSATKSEDKFVSSQSISIIRPNTLLSQEEEQELERLELENFNFESMDQLEYKPSKFEMSSSELSSSQSESKQILSNQLCSNNKKNKVSVEKNVVITPPKASEEAEKNYPNSTVECSLVKSLLLSNKKILLEEKTKIESISVEEEILSSELEKLIKQNSAINEPRKEKEHLKKDNEELNKEFTTACKYIESYLEI